MRGLGEICECRQSMARYDHACHLAEELRKKDAAEKGKNLSECGRWLRRISHE